MSRHILMRSTAIAMALATGHFMPVMAQTPADSYQDLPLALRPEQANTGTAGNFQGFSWSVNGTANDDGSASLDDGAALGLGYDSTSVSVRGKWDNRYGARGGLTVGAILDDAGQNALGAGMLANDEVTEFYGQFLTILPEIDPHSSFTLGEYISREEQNFATGKADVWGYTTYLNWFKRGSAGQSPDDNLPPALRGPLQTVMDNLSAISGTAAYTYTPKVRQGTQGAPRTHALDLSMRAVSPTLLGPYFPVSAGGGINFADYDQVDGTSDFETVATGGLGLAFQGSAYFGHTTRWLIGFGADMDTDGVIGGTVAGELESLALSYRQTSDQDKTFLISWRVSDLWTGQDGRTGPNGFDMTGPASFRSTPSDASASEQFAAAERTLARLGFLPPTGPEAGPLPGQGPAGTGGTTGGTGNALQFSASGVSQQPMDVQRAILRTQALQKTVQDQKNASTVTQTTTSSPAARAVITGLTLTGPVGFGAGEEWATFTSIQNPTGSTFTATCDVPAAGVPTVSLTANQILVDLSGVLGTCDGVTVFQDGVSLGNVPACFIAGTLVMMADGSTKPIEAIQTGDRLKGADGTVNNVLELHRPKLGQQHLYAINGSRFFVSDGHPFMTTQGWKAMDVAMAKQANPTLEIGKLEVGDMMITETGEQRVERIEKQSAPAETQLYNFSVTGNRTYYVLENGTGYLVHNK